MCAIVGVMNLKEENLSIENIDDLDKAMKVMHHRGPDDSGVCGMSFRKQESLPCQTTDELKGRCSETKMGGVY